jgi:hypothetical protein
LTAPASWQQQARDLVNRKMREGRQQQQQQRQSRQARN